MRYLDPTISNYTKAISAGIGAAHVYAERIAFDNERGEQSELLVLVAQCRAALESGDMLWHELPLRVQREIEQEMREQERATAPAPADRRYSTHVERKLTRKRRQVAEEMQQAQERGMRGVERLAEAWGARVRGNIAPLVR